MKIEGTAQEDDRLRTLYACRDAVARQIDRLESNQTANEAQGRDIAILTKELSRLMDQIAELSPVKLDDEIDDLTKKREARRAGRSNSSA